MLVDLCQTELASTSADRADLIDHEDAGRDPDDKTASAAFFRDFPHFRPGACADKCNSLCPAARKDGEGSSSDE